MLNRIGDSMVDLRNRRAAYSAIIAGILWLVLSVHAYSAHGLTEDNEMRLVLGFTWMDDLKLLALVPLLLVPALLFLRNRTKLSRVGLVGFYLTLVALAITVVAGVGEYWVFPWGSYALTFEESSFARTAGFIRTMSVFVLTIGMAIYFGSLVRSGVVRLWVAALVVVGTLSMVFLMLFPPIPIHALAWFALGYEIWEPKGTN